MPQNSPQQNRPASPQQAPDPASSYERAKPEKEAGAGSLDSPVGEATPTDQPDRLEQTVPHRQDPARQLNAHDDPGGTGGSGQPSRQRDLSRPDPDDSDKTRE
jgi:hypothetical protein